ncbi:trypsin beta-like [Teleopsis dalmanni]|uniref:trypsin beta-like n=1 Tax=Teleopsis dalmanni TaxID=139649 RepID=UPI0018CF7097|nr:trypsin beta-like [Teleopsis dalmanni]
MSRSALCCLFFLLCWSIFTDAKSTRKHSTRNRQSNKSVVIGGKLVEEDEAPWQIVILNKHRAVCSGSLLRNNVVLTAAECLKDIEPADLIIRAGSNHFKTGGQLRKVRETVYHPKYNEGSHAYNVAMLSLIRPLNSTKFNLRYVNLPESSDEFPSSVSIYGWGIVKNSTSSTVTKRLRQTKVKVYSERKCSEFLGDEKMIEIVFCAGDRIKKVDICNDDIGSPAMGPKNTQFGIVSESKACQTDSHTTIFTNVFSIKPWIINTLNAIK